MSLMDNLMALDAKEVGKLPEKTMKSESLSRLLGEDTEIKIRAVDGDRFTALSATGFDDEGNILYDKIFTANALVVCEGLIEPSLKNEHLMKHFGAPTPVELAKKLFGGEINKISVEIKKLSGFGSDEEKKVKNS